MAKLKHNIIYNFLGSAWFGLLTLAVTPVQVHYLGVEAFGFVGIIAILQVLLGTLDLGISATVTKVISSDHSAQHLASADAINTASTLYWVIALLIALLLWLNADGIAQFWLNRTHLDLATVSLGMQIIALYLGLRWPVAFYTGVITGIQRLDVLNIIKAGVHSLRLLGGVLVLIITPDLIIFLLWFAFSSGVELLVYAVMAYRLYPNLKIRPFLSLEALKNIWRYSAMMNAIALLGLLLSQADRLAVTQFLSLESLGYYAIAYNASIAIALIQGAINGASFPAFAQAFSSGQHKELVSHYDRVSELTALVVTLPCFMLIFFGHDILQLWINAKVADEASTAMAWLALGFFLNALVSNAYMAAMACGQPRLPLLVSLVALIVYAPALYWLVHRFGINGAAMAYAGLNLLYVLTLIPMVQNKVIGQTVKMWIRANVSPFLLAALVGLGSAKILISFVTSGWLAVLLMISGVVLYAILAWHWQSPALRAIFLGMLQRPGFLR